MARKPADDSIWVLEKLLDHPHGLELAKIFSQLEKDVQADAQPDPDMQADAQPDPERVNKAMTLVYSKGIRTPRYVLRMSNTELQEWIDKNS